MKLKKQIKIFKKDQLYADYLFKYPSSYLFKDENNLKLVEFNHLLKNDKNLVYIHIPFCDSICKFCNIHAIKLSHYNLIKNYLNKLFEEIEYYSKILKGNIDGVYIGGGTPTKLKPQDLDILLNKVYSSFQVDDDSYIEIDAHPSSLNKSKLDILKKYQVNQITIGIQSMEDRVLNKVNRNEQKKESIKKISQLLNKYNIDIHFDFIVGLPGETLKGLLTNVDEVLEYTKPKSISINSFDPTLETVLFKNDKKEYKRKKYKKKSKKKQNYIINYLSKKYDIDRGSNFFFKNFFQNHYNVWGMGAGAYGFVRGKGFFKNYNYQKYIKSKFPKLGFKSTLKDEKIMFILHNYDSDYLSVNYESIFGTNIISDFGDKLDYFLSNGYATINNRELKFSFKGNSISKFLLIRLYSERIINLYN